MSKISLDQLKDAILRALATDSSSGSSYAPRQRKAHKMNLIGRPFQSGELEASLKTTFAPDERVLAARAFDELKRDEQIVPTYDDLADPENWVVITDAGLSYLRHGPTSGRPPALTGGQVSVPKLTLDTNCVIYLLDVGAQTPNSVEVLSEIIRYGLSSKADIAITTQVEADLGSDPDQQRKDQMLRTIDMLPIVGTVSASDQSTRLASEIQSILFPGLKSDDKRYQNKRMDIEHLVGHVINKRDVFVTTDNGIIKKRDALHASPGIVVMEPAECLRYLEQLARSNEPKVLKPVAPAPGYHSPALRGKVTFDYSNNNGSYTIGEGFLLFETKWSKASDNSIHAYTDAPSIDALALPKGAMQVNDIEDVTKFDYSSRVRTPQEGQIVIWRNKNGAYAATKVLDVKDDTRSDDKDELTFEYIILTGGQTSFKKP